MTSIAVLGGGISGLAAAWRLQARGADVTLYEAQARTGGVIRSTARDGFLVDEGPNTLVARHIAVEETIVALGLDAERVWANKAAAKRYVVRDGVLVALPTSPGALLRTPLLSARAKLRLLREPFVRPSTSDDEPLADFVRRRLGSDVLDYAVDPFVGGILAGDPARLSTRYAFPPLWALEREQGSLARGLFHKARQRTGAARPSTLPFSFRRGMQAFPDALARALGESVQTNTTVLALESDGEAWTVTTQHDGEPSARRFDGVISALPLHRLATLGPEAGLDTDALVHVAHTDLTVLALGFRRDQIAHPLDGFGLLVPSREAYGILGVLFSSTLFPGRAPEGHALLTCFVGGRRAPERAGLPLDDLVALAIEDLDALLGIDGKPTFVHRTHWQNVIPQAEIGYGRVLDTLDSLEERHPRLRFAGSYRYGVSLSDTLRSGLDAADRFLS